MKMGAVGRALALTGFLVVAFLAMVFGYAHSGKTHVVQRTPPTANGINVAVDLVSIDPERQQMTVRTTLLPEGRFRNAADDSFAVPLRMTSRFALKETVDTTIEEGQPIGGAYDFDLPIEGNVEIYPFDHYHYSNDDPQNPGQIVPAPLVKVEEILDDGSTAPVPVSTWIGDPTGLSGWSEHWRLIGNGPTLNVQVNFERSGAVLAAVAVVVMLVLALAVLSASVAWATITGRRPVEATMAGWFAGMLFALIPLQGFLPGAPQIGAWIDVVVFFWVEIILLAGLAVFIIAWFRYREPPDYSHLRRNADPEPAPDENAPAVDL